jgi:hypothetical protein
LRVYGLNCKSTRFLLSSCAFGLPACERSVALSSARNCNIRVGTIEVCSTVAELATGSMSIICCQPEFRRSLPTAHEILLYETLLWSVIVVVYPAPAGRGTVLIAITINYASRAPLLIARGGRSGEGHPSIRRSFKSSSRTIFFYDSHYCLRLSQQSLQHPEVSHRDNLK